MEHDRVVWCTYADAVFNKCVPKENCYQVLHQAAVTKSAVGMFVTAKVEEDCGSIIQIVNILIPPVDRTEYMHGIEK